MAASPSPASRSPLRIGRHRAARRRCHRRVRRADLDDPGRRQRHRRAGPHVVGAGARPHRRSGPAHGTRRARPRTPPPPLRSSRARPRTAARAKAPLRPRRRPRCPSSRRSWRRPRPARPDPTAPEAAAAGAQAPAAAGSRPFARPCASTTTASVPGLAARAAGELRVGRLDDRRGRRLPGQAPDERGLLPARARPSRRRRRRWPRSSGWGRAAVRRDPGRQAGRDRHRHQGLPERGKSLTAFYDLRSA